MKNLIVASTSTLYGGKFLEYMHSELKTHFESIGSLLFIPFARPGGITYEKYTNMVASNLSDFPFSVKGIHEFDDPKKAVQQAEAIFIGGGNTFVLVDTLQQIGLMDLLREALKKGVPYLGTSAGSNIVGQNVKTTNDMPIIHPVSLEALGLLPFNINPHFLDPDLGSTHNGETRETRIREFHTYNNTMVVGLREGSWLLVKDDHIELKGPLTARIFQKDKEPFELKPGSDLNRLIL